jgi:Spy/CpxP family protein refolding chaperone
MSTIKTLAIAAALAVGASSLAMPAMAQQTGNPASNAASSGGPGTHQGAEKTGSASNNQKVEKNQNGYQGGHQ